MKTFSNRFEQFLWFNCRFIGTDGRFIGPEWAKIVLRHYQPIINNQWLADLSFEDIQAISCPFCHAADRGDKKCWQCGNTL